MGENKQKDYSDLSIYHYIGNRVKHYWARYILMIITISVSVSVLTTILSLLFGLYNSEIEILPYNYEFFRVRLSVNQAEALARWLLTAAGLIVISSTAAIFNTIRSSVWESRKDIGILKSIGLTNREIGKIYTIETLWVSLSSWLVGLFGGLIVSNQFLHQLFLGGDSAMFFAPSSSGFGVIIITFIITSIISIMGSHSSAVMASRQDPIAMIK
ncbi:MAG: FtsX-like permease family protein [Thermoplasmata archaeon]|nr:FtsX-like permease family protein [Thermoplasmata archaeon]